MKVKDEYSEIAVSFMNNRFNNSRKIWTTLEYDAIICLAIYIQRRRLNEFDKTCIAINHEMDEESCWRGFNLSAGSICALDDT